jgi:thiol-disulfide isomerase/thioredoxin/mono/diheme cytochrome c family protein
MKRLRVLLRSVLLLAAAASTAAGAALWHQDPAADTDDTSTPLAPPSPRDAREVGIGRYVADVTGHDVAGTARSWRSGRGEKVTVLAFTSVTCPLCRKFAPSLARIEAAYASKGVKFVYVNVSGVDSTDEMHAQIKDHGFKGLYLDDKGQSIVTMLGAKTTTEVFVVDAANTLVYRGAVSDQYGVGFSHDSPRRRFLEQALDAALAGKRPAVSATSSPGCAIELEPVAAASAAPAVTYARDIARIMQSNCIECHRSGGVAPFSLDTFESVSRRASMIRSVVEEGIMPPWFASPHANADGKPAASPWANDRSLSRAERDAIVTWIAAGKPKGDDKDLPLPRAFDSGGWTIPQPDAVFQLPEPIAIKAEGTMPYQHVMVPTHLAEDTWVRATQIIPTDRSVVHHVLVFALPEAVLTDPALRRRAAIDESRGYWAAYVPGNDSVVFPEGMAKRLPKGSVLMFQIHYTPSGKATKDQMKIGLTFASNAPKHVVRTAAVVERRIEIPPGASSHEESASIRLPADAKILAFLPHMHVRGKAFRYELTPPGDEQPTTVLDIPRYDFNWQLRYTLREPLDAPAGSTLTGTAWYDNSADNPANPDPSKTVRWGPQTFDEMMLGYIEYHLVNEDPAHPDELPEGATPRQGPGVGRAGGPGTRLLSFDRLRSQFDANKDGRIEKEEVPDNLHRQFDRLDLTLDHDAALRKPPSPLIEIRNRKGHVPLARRSVAGHLFVRRTGLCGIKHDEHRFIVDPEHRASITVARQGLQAEYTRVKRLHRLEFGGVQDRLVDTGDRWHGNEWYSRSCRVSSFACKPFELP